ncbi:MAG: phosphoadenylyl-sulfate reductase [Phycisphaeraceae bacterium]
MVIQRQESAVPCSVSDARELDLEAVNAALEDAPAQRVVQWASEMFADRLVMTSSFGAQSAVMLHLVTRVVPDVPVIFIDTGYLFPETYRFADHLADRLKLNLKVYRPQVTTGWLEAIHGRLWEQGAEGLAKYLQIVKVEPMQRALRELNVAAWLAGLRRGQTTHRSQLRRVERQNGQYKVHPILAWTTKDVHEYLKQHDLPYHPLYEQGYVSIGDVHSTVPITADEHERAGRFSGLRQECGLHLPASAEESQSRDSSSL